MNTQDLAKEILSLVGGENNISAFTHCATRLRFNLKDDSKAQVEELKKLEGVLTAQFSSGQLQVVIGAKVQSVFDAVSSLISIPLNNADAEEKKDKKHPVSAIVETIAGVFSPTLPVLVGCGMMKAIVSLIVNFGWLPAESGMIVVLSMIGDLIFYFFPFFLALSAAKKFKTSEYMALILAAAYMYPTIMDGAKVMAEGGPASLDFLGLPMLFVNYKSTVIPIIISV